MKPFLVDMMNATQSRLTATDKCMFHRETMALYTKWPPTERCQLMQRAWESQPGLPSIAKKTCTSVIAAERFSKLRATGRFSCLQHLSRAYRRITWHSAGMEACSLPDQPHQALIAFIGSIRKGT